MEDVRYIRNMGNECHRTIEILVENFTCSFVYIRTTNIDALHVILGVLVEMRKIKHLASYCPGGCVRRGSREQRTQASFSYT